MKNTIKLLVIIILFFNSFEVLTQVIKGNVEYQYTHDHQDFMRVSINGKATKCDSNGNFELTNVSMLDTIKIIPIQNSVKVKIYNLPKNIDTIQLNSIPLFKNVDTSGIPIIHFKNKRAARRYFKEFEKEINADEEDLLFRTQAYRFIFNNQQYELLLKKCDDGYEILIDLKNY